MRLCEKVCDGVDGVNGVDFLITLISRILRYPAQC